MQTASGNFAFISVLIAWQVSWLRARAAFPSRPEPVVLKRATVYSGGSAGICTLFPILPEGHPAMR